MRNLILTVLLTIIWAGNVYAQAKDLLSPPALDFRTQDTIRDRTQPLAPYEFSLPGYEPISFKGLFGLYWKSGIVKPENKDAVAEYLRTSECQIYAATFKNDFVWPDVLKSTSGFIMSNKRKFHSQFSFIQPIALDRYSPEKEWFVVTPDTQYLNVTTMTFADYPTVQTDCLAVGTVYPRAVPTQAQIKFSHPFSLTYVKMKPDFAQQYITYMQNKKEALEVIGIGRDRYAYVQFYFTITGLDASKTTRQSASFLGSLDGYTLYADQAKTMPLYEWINPRKDEGEPIEEEPTVTFSIK